MNSVQPFSQQEDQSLPNSIDVIENSRVLKEFDCECGVKVCSEQIA